MRKTASIGLFLMTLASAPLYGGEGRIPIWEGTTITEPGYYILTRDISFLGGGSGILIDADDVVLDLNGFTISNNVQSAGYAVRIAAGRINVTVRNGRLSDAERGVSHNSNTGRARVYLESLEITDMSGFGIYLAYVDYAEVRGCLLDTTRGMWLNGNTGPFGGRIIGNTVVNSTDTGIYANGLRGGEVRRNLLRTYGAAGIRLAADPGWDAGGNIVEGNICRDGSATARGLALDSDNNIIVNNILRGNQYGVYAYSVGNVFSGNQINDNGNDGIYFPGNAFRNLIDNNQLEGNSGCGITFVEAEKSQALS